MPTTVLYLRLGAAYLTVYEEALCSRAQRSQEEVHRALFIFPATSRAEVAEADTDGRLARLLQEAEDAGRLVWLEPMPGRKAAELLASFFKRNAVTFNRERFLAWNFGEWSNTTTQAVKDAAAMIEHLGDRVTAGDSGFGLDTVYT